MEFPQVNAIFPVIRPFLSKGHWPESLTRFMGTSKKSNHSMFALDSKRNLTDEKVTELWKSRRKSKLAQLIADVSSPEEYSQASTPHPTRLWYLVLPGSRGPRPLLPGQLAPELTDAASITTHMIGRDVDLAVLFYFCSSKTSQIPLISTIIPVLIITKHTRTLNTVFWR